MKSTTRTAAALVAATIGLAALTPTAFAAGPNGPGNDNGGRQMHQRQGGDDMRGGGRGGVLNLICAPNGAEQLEKKLVSLSYDAKLTDAQKPLYEALKTAALTAQTSFADTCASVMPAAPAAPVADAAPAADATTATPPVRPDMLTALQNRLKIDEARVAALTSVMPSFEAFFNSLSDEQKAALAPQGRMGGDNGPNGDHRGGRGGDDHRDGQRKGRNG